MIRLRGTVEYQDGRTETFEAGSTVFVVWESYCRRQGIAEPYDQRNANTLAHFVAHAIVANGEGFDVWVKGVRDVDTQQAEPIPPTLLEASPGR